MTAATAPEPEPPLPEAASVMPGEPLVLPETEPAPYGRPAPTSAAAIDPAAPTVFNLRREHVELLQAWPKLEDEARHARANGFRERLTAAGSYLEDFAERDAVQGLIDYWTATLAALPSHEGFPTLMALAPFEEGNRPDLKRIVTSPFVGLNAFGASDKDRFFGRLAASDQLLQRVIAEPLVVVAGPSGSGKSSLVFAGLIPKLHDQDGWRILAGFTPGNDPIASLLQPFRPANAPSGWLDAEREALVKDPKRLVGLAEAIPGKPVMLPFDQGEEIFTFEVEEATRQSFFGALAALVDAGHGHRLVITVRSDFLEQLLATAILFGTRDRARTVYATEALTSRELQDAITGPSQRIGLKIDPRVVDNLVREVVGEPAALPLLQFTLTRLWSRAQADRITWEDYQAVGRPADALRQAAEEVWEQLSLNENRDAARLIFLELVRPSCGAESVRGGRVRREALRKLAAADRIDRVLARFVTAGLIRRTPGTEDNDDRFEVAHETLIRQWPRLVGWLDERSRDNEQIGRLMASAALWRGSGDKGYLLDGKALGEAGLAVAANPELADYVAASRRWRHVRLRRLTSMAAIVLVLLLGGAVAYRWQRQDTWAERERAQQEAGRVVDADLAGASAEARANIAEQTLARLLIADPKLLASIPSPLQPRVAAAPILPSNGWLRHARGYDTGFLGVAMPAPRASVPLQILDYVNFSVGYDPALRMPRYVISNFDRAPMTIPPLAITGFSTDPRVPPAEQPDAYAGLAVDSGRVPLVAWREIGWQGSGARAMPRNDFVTASGVQPWAYNQGRWSVLERALLSIGADRMVFITGPLLAVAPAGQPAGQPAPQPQAYWKVAIYRDGTPAAALHADAYVVPLAEPRTSQPISTYRVELAALASMTGLGFTLPSTQPPIAPAAPTAVPVAGDGPVYLQFAQISRGDARGISDALGKLGFHVPGEERVLALGLHEVRFYYPRDRDRAARLAGAAEEVLTAQGFGDVTVSFKLLRPRPGTRLPKPGVLELWLTVPAKR